MKKAKFLAMFLPLMILISASAPVFGLASLDEGSIGAKSALLIEMETQTVLYAKNPDQHVNPASITKIMTVFLAVEAIERGDIFEDELVTASSTSHNDLSWDSSTQNIRPGEEMRFIDLLYCAMVASANEACNIIGERLGGGNVKIFIGMMNERAAELGCFNTHYENTHGLTAEGHLTTANDMYIITSEALKHPLFAKICNTEYCEIPATNMSAIRKFHTTNNLISKSRTEDYFYPTAFGVKTGSTEAAGYCLISTASRDGIHLMAIVFGAENIKREDETLDTRSFTETLALFKWGFSNWGYKKVLSASDPVAEIPLLAGKNTDFVVVKPASSLTLLLPNDVDTAGICRDIVIYSQRDDKDLLAPVKEGDVLGEMTLTYDGKKYGPIDLIANTSVELSPLSSVLYTVKLFFTQSWVWVIGVVVLMLLFLYFYMAAKNRSLRRKRGYRD